MNTSESRSINVESMVRAGQSQLPVRATSTVPAPVTEQSKPKVAFPSEMSSISDPISAASRPCVAQGPTLTPPIDIYDSDEGLVLEADLPGVTEETLSIVLEDSVLHLKASVFEAAPPNARPLHLEYRTGGFERSFILGDDVDREKIRAELYDGVLRVTLPRSDRSRTRRIEVNSHAS